MDKRINIGDKIDLEIIEKRLAVDPDKKPNIYVSQVLDEGPNDSLYVAMPFQEGKLIPLSVGQELNATFFSKSGLLQSKAVVIGRFKKGSLFLMEIQLLSDLKKVQRREFFRYPCRIPLEYRIVTESEKNMIESDEEYEMDETAFEWKNGIMLDLSGGGIRFVSTVQEKKDIIMEVCFEILLGDDTQKLYAFAKLLRTERNPNQNALFDNRLEFWHMDDSLRETIIRFIFDEQRRNRSKKLGNDV
ncbi:MAG: flagellar brake protein [Lachnospiraceae bacterium]